MFQRLKKILIVDSNSDYRKLLKSVLADLIVDEADSATDALEHLRVETYELVVMDFRLSDKSGVEVLHWCRANGIHIPIFFMSAKSVLSKAEDVALADCCVSLFMKPLNLKAFTSALLELDSKESHVHSIHHYHGVATQEIHI